LFTKGNQRMKSQKRRSFFLPTFFQTWLTFLRLKIICFFEWKEWWLLNWFLSKKPFYQKFLKNEFHFCHFIS
jgi:hypothetical protein